MVKKNGGGKFVSNFLTCFRFRTENRTRLETTGKNNRARMLTTLFLCVNNWGEREREREKEREREREREREIQTETDRRRQMDD